MFVCCESDIYQCDITIHFSTGSSQVLMHCFARISSKYTMNVTIFWLTLHWTWCIKFFFISDKFIDRLHVNGHVMYVSVMNLTNEDYIQCIILFCSRFYYIEKESQTRLQFFWPWNLFSVSIHPFFIKISSYKPRVVIVNKEHYWSHCGPCIVLLHAPVKVICRKAKLLSVLSKRFATHSWS